MSRSPEVLLRDFQKQKQKGECLEKKNKEKEGAAEEKMEERRQKEKREKKRVIESECKCQ